MTDTKTKATHEKAKAASAKVEAENVAANSALPELSDKDRQAAQVEGMKEDIKETAKDAHRFLTDGQLIGEPPARQFPGKSDVQQYVDLLELGPEDFEAAVSGKTERTVPEEKVAGLLEMERSGQNRTLYVKAMCKRLAVKSPYEVTSAGPAYTNDATPVTAL